jgi:hypothetical protein
MKKTKKLLKVRFMVDMKKKLQLMMYYILKMIQVHDITA